MTWPSEVTTIQNLVLVILNSISYQAHHCKEASRTEMGKDENSCGIQCLSTGHSERGDAWLLWNVFFFTIIVIIIGLLHSAFCEYILDLSHRIHKSQKNINTSFWSAALIQCWNHGKDNQHHPSLTSCQSKYKEQQLYHQHHHMRLTWLMRMRTRMVKIMMVIILNKIKIIMPIKIMMMMITETRDWPSAVLRYGLTVRYIASLTICQRRYCIIMIIRSEHQGCSKS